MLTIRKRNSVQTLIGIKGFSRYGLVTRWGELLYFQVAPTNINVLSRENIEIKIRQLMMLLSSVPDLEIVCLDACECFDGNQAYLRSRLEAETQPAVRQLLQRDTAMLEGIQSELSNARQFLFVKRCVGLTPEQIFQTANRVEKTISEQGFEVRRLTKPELKQFLAVWFEASMNGDRMPDFDGEEVLP